MDSNTSSPDTSHPPIIPGFCQCGCGQQTRKRPDGSYAPYANIRHHPQYKKHTERMQKQKVLKGDDLSAAIERIFKKDIKSVLSGLQTAGLSTTQIHKELEGKLGLPFSKRHLHRWLGDTGLNLDRSSAGRKRWKQGLMNDAVRKGKATLVRSQILGSKIEERIRWELNIEFATWNDYEAIVGFTNWTLLQRWEIDIPIVLLRRTDQKVLKIAVEIDGERWHKDTEKWVLKQSALLEAGWEPIRVLISDEDQKRKAHQIYVRGDVKCLTVVADLIRDIKQIVKRHYSD